MLDRSEDLTITRGRWCVGVQVHRAQRLRGYVDVVDVVKYHWLIPQGLVVWGGGGGLIPPRGLPPHSGGTNQLVVSWRSSVSGTLEREAMWNKNHGRRFGLGVCFCPLCLVFTEYDETRKQRELPMGVTQNNMTLKHSMSRIFSLTATVTMSFSS